MNVTIKNYGSITIYQDEDAVSLAKDEMLCRMFHARNKDTIGGYDKWIDMLSCYYEGNFKAMTDFFSTCRNSVTKTRVLKCLKIIQETK